MIKKQYIHPKASVITHMTHSLLVLSDDRKMPGSGSTGGDINYDDDDDNNVIKKSDDIW